MRSFIPLIFIQWATFLGIEEDVGKKKKHPLLWPSVTHLSARDRKKTRRQKFGNRHLQTFYFRQGYIY